MKSFGKRIVALMVVAFLLTVCAYSQSEKKSVSVQNGSVAGSVLKGTGSVAVLVVGSAAKAAWATTKVVGKDIAAPVAISVVKPVITKAAPHAAGYLLKKSVKYLLPLAVKLSVL